ncbi:tRNA (guanosine(37)-N1)-methyltransferase TrmD [Hymenobacter busanensis]|uniref:tRNA (guanine-N(1)-)-methyltransferase n=1 Tax=Hymenobacter busanensis TaxID=2607656 RepID=A0A7L5A097_9BACT|nr:tRNA (guanosine(37)-N1)-methyltransferase TrmD [Hymenobacter busanensis]KAA9338365.1 tRNA (guanosine(37)-N1)-methyltransferase TrmD [Hymenobacter busanensis]QHJ09209.1 tRNA (guanosine(37)-N1)-methyltransferase TrmD [Hymenobacter busanensis]
MRFDIVTCQPELLRSPLGHSIVQRAQDKGLAEIHLHDLRQFAINKHGQIDDYVFGGGAGMVLRPEPIAACLDGLLAERRYDAVIYLTPDGPTFRQGTANRLSLLQNIILLCGHYKGVDERIRTTYITDEISIGDFVLSGGELGAAVVVDAVVRLLPGVLGNEESALSDSFQDNLLSPPVYTRPAEWRGQEVPAILLSGDTPKVEEWRHEQALERTRQRRPDLLADLPAEAFEAPKPRGTRRKPYKKL